ncbi:class I SAM-dependent methyltransferase [Rhodopila sp.]|uniref:class I SAM-dependent methyltransferase n=1 Tax=Rhodopila sp. TaxID=2480087 RepID=UPI003D139EF1
MRCSVCGGSEFVVNPVIWDDLAAAWQLSPNERAYVDRQQGKACTGCSANLRSIVLADALRDAFATTLLLRDFVASDAAGFDLLEINEAGTLGPILKQMPHHTLAEHPAIDMHKISYPDDSFDVAVHSDTLEHVEHPIRALEECRRVLRPGGSLCFTVPTIVGRLTRTRAGLAKSWHGWPSETGDDYLVHTEFGADMWTFVLSAGFSALKIFSVSFPDAIAISARK